MSNYPPSLARHILESALWVLVAPVVIPIIGFALLGEPFAALLGLDLMDPTVLWLVVCGTGALHLAGLSFWASRIGAGALAGEAGMPPRWIVLALLLGPACLLVPNLIADMLLGGEADRLYSEGFDPSMFAIENWTPAFIFFVIVIAPLVEEVTFRGVAIGALVARGMPTLAAGLVSSALFALVHAQYSLLGMVVIFAAGFGLALLRIASGSVGVAILAHAAANASLLGLSWLG